MFFKRATVKKEKIFSHPRTVSEHKKKRKVLNFLNKYVFDRDYALFFERKKEVKQKFMFELIFDKIYESFNQFKRIVYGL